MKQEIGDMTVVGEYKVHAYFGFHLISSSIEFLGACLDPNEWGDRDLSEKRFRLAIKILFPQNYQKYNNKKNINDLYSNLRCSLSHSLRPGNHIGLSERKHGAKSLIEQEGKLIICFEDFLNDFQIACEKLIKMIDNKVIDYDKVYGHIISTPEE
jgi:hypothetical protein